MYVFYSLTEGPTYVLNHVQFHTKCSLVKRIFTKAFNRLSLTEAKYNTPLPASPINVSNIQTIGLNFEL